MHSSELEAIILAALLIFSVVATLDSVAKNQFHFADGQDIGPLSSLVEFGKEIRDHNRSGRNNEPRLGNGQQIQPQCFSCISQ